MQSGLLMSSLLERRHRVAARTPVVPPTAFSLYSFHETRMVDGYEIQPFDVICKRDKTSKHHAGNTRFQRMVETRVDRYVASKRRKEKTLIIKEIIDEIRNSGGFFIRQQDPPQISPDHHDMVGSLAGLLTRHNSEAEGEVAADVRPIYFDIEDKKAGDKIGHAMRLAVDARAPANATPKSPPSYVKETSTILSTYWQGLRDGKNQRQSREVTNILANARFVKEQPAISFVKVDHDDRWNTNVEGMDRKAPAADVWKSGATTLSAGPAMDDKKGHEHLVTLQDDGTANSSTDVSLSSLAWNLCDLIGNNPREQVNFSGEDIDLCSLSSLTTVGDFLAPTMLVFDSKAYNGGFDNGDGDGSVLCWADIMF